MALEILYSIVGDYGRAVITWAVSHQAIVATAFLIWATALFSGKSQLRRLQKNTSALVLERAHQFASQGKAFNSHEFYDQLYPDWAVMVRRSAYFIPHRWELWPMPAVPSIVRNRIGFTPEWVKQLLQSNDANMK